MIRPFIGLSAGALLLAATAQAQGPAVAIVAAAATDPTHCDFMDVQSYLLATGQFSAVDLVDCVTQTPTAQDLAPYAAILTWSNSSYEDNVALGDLFADYVDGGGGVVVATFANTTASADRFLGGRWLSGSYEVIVTQQGTWANQGGIGEVADPAHPAMHGVQTLYADFGICPHPSTPLAPGATRIASWPDGAALVVEGARPNRIDLGLFPPSSQCRWEYWESAGDGDTLVANSLLYVAGDYGPGASYCQANPNSTGEAGRTWATGSAQVAQNDLTLIGHRLPPQSFGYFITSRTQGFVPNPGGSEGNLCLAGSIGRYVRPGQVQQAGAEGQIALAVDLALTPQPMGATAVAPGETWSFQAWFRDSSPSGATSNFTNGLAVVFE